MAQCTKCGVEQRRPGQRWGRACFAAYQRAHRPKYSELPAEERRRNIARSYINTLLRIGKLERLPCEVCGDPDTKASHRNYSKPRDVRWLCSTHRARSASNHDTITR